MPCSDIPFCHEAETLRKHDLEHGIDCARTFYMYLLHQGNAAATADAMHLHRNTTRARLEKIFSILGDDSESPIDRMRIFVSLNTLTCERRSDVGDGQI